MKKILLTGATDGIGLETAKRLADQGHHLLIHGRNEEKLALTKQNLSTEFPQARIDTYHADLSRFDELRGMLQALLHAHNTLDVLINNAGVFKTASAITQDGLDSRFVVNTLAPYIITQTLLRRLAPHGRIVNLSSAAQAPIDFELMEGEKLTERDFDAYAQSKLALTIWTQELSKTLNPEQVAVAVNPGSLLASKMVKEGFGVSGNDLSIGADILVRASLSTEFNNASGKYFDNDSGKFAKPHPDAQDNDICQQLMTKLGHLSKTYFGDPL